MIAKLFKERRKRFNARCAKYSRYVFNDHFILVLLFLLGFVLVQYSQLLKHFPKNPWAIILGLLVLCLLLPFWGNIATYLEPADKHYLLVKEEEVLDHVKKATGRAFRFWVIVQTLIFILVIPLFLALGLPVWGVILVAVAMAILKYVIFQKKAQPFYKQSGLNWAEVIAAENKRQQSILKFFSSLLMLWGLRRV
ncbi:MAG: ABC transporter permease [Streptococcus sp.]